MALQASVERPVSAWESSMILFFSAAGNVTEGKEVQTLDCPDIAPEVDCGCLPVSRPQHAPL
jgi:hypothetical protein